MNRINSQAQPSHALGLSGAVILVAVLAWGGAVAGGVAVSRSWTPRPELVVHPGLAKKPAQRYESSAAMVRALEEALRPATPAHAAATVTRRPSAARRQKISAEQTFGSILLALLFVVGLVMWFRRRDESETPDPAGVAVIAPPRVVAPPRARPRRLATVRDAGVRR